MMELKCNLNLHEWNLVEVVRIRNKMEYFHERCQKCGENRYKRVERWGYGIVATEINESAWKMVKEKSNQQTPGSKGKCN